MKAHPTCKELIATLSDYVDGSLDDSFCTELERHLRDCEKCRVVVNTLRKTVDLVHQSSRAPSMPVEVRERLFHRLNLDDFIKR